MSTQNGGVLDDLKQAHSESAVHLWGGTIAAILSTYFPILGLIAAHSGLQLIRTMDRSWFGIAVAAVGLLHFVLWIGYVLSLL